MSRGLRQKGGKAKPRLAAVSIWFRLRTLFSTPDDRPTLAREANALAAIAVGSMHARSGSRAPGTAVQYMGAATSGARRRGRAQIARAESFRRRLDQRESAAPHR